MLENREVTMRLMPDLFAAPPRRAGRRLSRRIAGDCLRSVAPRADSAEATIVLLTPGPFNSAYYEHSFLADKLGVELVEGRDLFVDDDIVYMRTTLGPKRVDVIYRRVDDEFLDPLVFNPDSVLGVPGLMGAYLAGNVTIANAVGTGVADDKAIYSYVPDLIKFYLAEEPLLQNVPTYRCREPDALKFVLERLDQLVVKEVNGSGGYGMLVGPHATEAQREFFAAKLKADPDNYIAQPTLALSTCPASFDAASRRAMSTCAPSCFREPTACASCPAASRGSRSPRGRWSSIRARAAAPRTPGSSTTTRARRAERCSRAPPTICSGSPARWSAPISSPARSRRR